MHDPMEPPWGLLTIQTVCNGLWKKQGFEGLVWGCRIGRIEGILRVIGADAAEPERVQRAEASVSSLMQQLTELQKQEHPLSEQVSGTAVPAIATNASHRKGSGSPAVAFRVRTTPH